MVSLWSNLKACESTSGVQLLSMARGAIENGSCNLSRHRLPGRRILRTRLPRRWREVGLRGSDGDLIGP